MESIYLYKLNALGVPLVFHLSVEESPEGYRVITEKGQVGGKMQVDVEDIIQGKNLGKANETTPHYQAMVIYNSKINKLKDKGYIVIGSGKVPLTGDITPIVDALAPYVGKTASGSSLPMLAVKDIKHIVFPCYVQRKYDGIRATGTDKAMISRRGKPIKSIDHILKDLRNRLKPGEEVDGEVYSHSQGFEQIVSSFKRKQTSSADLTLRIYDMYSNTEPDLPYYRRLRRIRRIVRLAGPSVQVCPTYKVNSLEEAKALFALFIEEGYEGMMLRNIQGVYEHNKRSKNLAKYKEFDEDEFTLVDVAEASGRDAGTALFVFKNFTARPMGSQVVRARYLRDRLKIIGKKVTVKYQGKSKSGVPRFPVAKAIRDYE